MAYVIYGLAAVGVLALVIVGVGWLIGLIFHDKEAEAAERARAKHLGL